MTWYARHIIAENNPRVLAALREDRRLEGHVYVVDSLSSFERSEREPYAIVIGDPPETLHREVVHRPAFPEAGLIFVREVVEADGHAEEWFGPDALAAKLDAELALALEPESPEDFELETETETEIGGVLRYCKALAQRSQSTVCFFSVDFWGGDCEDARGYVFTPNEEIHYLRRDDTMVSARSSHTPKRERRVFAGDALTLCLLHFDVLLPSGHFVPHRRSFPWAQFRDA